MSEIVPDLTKEKERLEKKFQYVRIFLLVDGHLSFKRRVIYEKRKMKIFSILHGSSTYFTVGIPWNTYRLIKFGTFATVRYSGFVIRDSKTIFESRI